MSLGGQHLIVSTIPGLSQERFCETIQADFTVAWCPLRPRYHRPPLGNEEGEEEEKEAVFIRDSITNEDSPNTHQAQRRPKPRVRRVRSLSTCLI